MPTIAKLNTYLFLGRGENLSLEMTYSNNRDTAESNKAAPRRVHFTLPLSFTLHVSLRTPN